MKNLNYFLDQYNLRTCDDSGREISRPKDLLFTHTGIIIGENNYTGQLMVFHNHPTAGPALVTFQKYANGMQCNYTNRSSDSRDVVLLRSFEQLQAKMQYKPMSYNCQDATSYSLEGKLKSHGRNNTLGLIAAWVLFSILSK